MKKFFVTILTRDGDHEYIEKSITFGESEEAVKQTYDTGGYEEDGDYRDFEVSVREIPDKDFDTLYKYL